MRCPTGPFTSLVSWSEHQDMVRAHISPKECNLRTLSNVELLLLFLPLKFSDHRLAFPAPVLQQAPTAGDNIHQSQNFACAFVTSCFQPLLIIANELRIAIVAEKGL